MCATTKHLEESNVSMPKRLFMPLLFSRCSAVSHLMLKIQKLELI